MWILKRGEVGAVYLLVCFFDALVTTRGLVFGPSRGLVMRRCVFFLVDVWTCKPMHIYLSIFCRNFFEMHSTISRYIHESGM